MSGEVIDAHGLEAQIARDSLERYCGCSINEFGSYLLLTNFPRYVKYFAESRGVPMIEGSMFKVAHSPKEDVSILDFKMGSPVAALVVDLCSFLPVKACLMLGMCGGLRRRYQVGEYFVPVAGIRGEGTSDFYYPPEVPALANFLMQRSVTQVLDDLKVNYHIGITHTTNIRFWEFNEEFKDRLKASRAQAIEMECATLFSASYKRKLPLGALLLISDLPLDHSGIKTKKSSQHVFDNYTQDHVEKGVLITQMMKKMQQQHVKGAHRWRNSAH
ncbi:MAG: AMP nucleosidase [Chlamydiales bacterium]|nr:AMP nucleosidase [Chlamydiales bacterium]